MEEAPFIKGCHESVKTKNIVVVPFFISDGLHAVEDIPVLLGEPERIVKERLAAGLPTWRNPTEKRRKTDLVFAVRRHRAVDGGRDFGTCTRSCENAVSDPANCRTSGTAPGSEPRSKIL